jgi:cystathionine gamma-synthase
MLAKLQARGRIGQVRLVDPSDTAAVTAALPGADLLWIESPTNPLLAVADLPALTAAARAEGVATVADSTFSTPLVLRPLEIGFDVVVHSATKYFSGHSDALLGVLVSHDEARVTAARDVRTTFGAVPGTAEAWLVLRGLRTLHLRVERAQANAAELARRLEGHPALERVRYPGLANDPGHARAAAQMDGFGSIVCVDVRGGAAAAEQLVSGCRLWTATTSLGGVESTLERRRRHSGESTAVPDSLVRLSVGVEDVEDLWEDLSRALDALTAED